MFNLRPLCLLRQAAAAAVLLGIFSSNVNAQLSCTMDYQITQTFANNAKWEMCYERRSREGIILSDIHYTTSSGERRKVLHQAAVAQIHVPYDDDGARFHDVSDYGLGTSGNLNDLQAADCPSGTRINEDGKHIICKQHFTDVEITVTATETRYGEALNLFSVTHVGAYNYIPEWTFLDDGTIDIAMGATGRLQRFGTVAEHGWPMNDTENPYGISHLHNYFWRLDFDLGGDAGNDFVDEIEYIADDSSKRTRSKAVTRFDIETARSVSPDTQRFWRVHDIGVQSNGSPSGSYDIIATETGHRDTGPSFEPFTFNDVYVTTARDCERFASHNPADGAAGCAANEDLSDFVNGESLADGDPVVWVGISFHHIPRDEEEPYMAAHWNQFRLAPRDWVAATETPSNRPPELLNPGQQSGTVGDSIALSLVAVDDDGDELSFEATGLPDGLQINSTTGEISGSLQSSGDYSVMINVTDGQGGSAHANFKWSVSAANSPPALQNPGPQSHETGQIVNLQISASDADNDLLTFSASDLPAGLTLSATSGLISGQPTQAGSYNTTVQVSDGQTEPVAESFNWVVVTAVVNTAPQITNPGKQSSVLDEPATLQINANDADGDAMQFSATGLPPGLTIDADNGLISGTATTAGDHTVIVTVDDGHGGVATLTFEWSVINGKMLMIGPVGFGLTGYDDAADTGYAMYTSERIQTRFVTPPIDSLSADHIVIVRYNGSSWQYVTDFAYVDFTPREDDLIVAALDFGADTVELLAGTDSIVHGIRSGYIDSDMEIIPNIWYGYRNMGEFSLTGTYILAHAD